MNFSESVEYLYNLGYELSVKKFGLENTIKLLAALENPEKNFPKIQIAGTNGKGSVCAFLDSICVSAGINAGLYTSPHLVSITERIKVGGAEITEKNFARHATIVRKASEKLVESGELEALPTFFEQVTAIALNYFAEQTIELAILETGLGGRFDSVTATNAEIVALTPIDYDHMDVLGNSLRAIASEKAAIIRADTRILVAPQKKEAEKVIYGKCRELGAEPVWAIPDTKLISDLGFGLLFVNFKTGVTDYKAEMWLEGKHQWVNANLAIYIAENLRDFGFRISKDEIELGIERTRHKGRLEFSGNFLFDGAHNVAGAQALSGYLEESIRQPIVMIFGSMKDKDLTEIGAILFPKAEKIIFTTPDNPRAAEAEDLLEFLPENFSRENVFVSENAFEALKIAQKISSEKDLILVTGSLYLIGEAQKILRAENYE